MNEKQSSRVTTILYSLLVLFVLIFSSSFLPGSRAVFLIPLAAYFVLAAALIILTLTAQARGRLRILLLLTGFSSLVFSVGVLYGVLGIWGFYSISDPLYLTTVIAAWIGFLFGAIASVVLIRRTGLRTASESQNAKP